LAASKAGLGSSNTLRRVEKVEAMDQGAVPITAAAEAADLPPEQQREVVAEARQGKPARQAVTERHRSKAPATSPGLAGLWSAWRRATAEEQTAFVAAAWLELPPEKPAAFVAVHAAELTSLLPIRRARRCPLPRPSPTA
jgi:hypothetical protein